MKPHNPKPPIRAQRKPALSRPASAAQNPARFSEAPNFSIVLPPIPSHPVRHRRTPATT